MGCGASKATTPYAVQHHPISAGQAAGSAKELHNKIGRGLWEAVLSLVGSDTSLAREPDGGTGELPLHKLLRTARPTGGNRGYVDAVSVVLEAYPEACTVPHVQGEGVLPLHLVLKHTPAREALLTDDDTAQEILQQLLCPGACEAKATFSGCGNADLPLHLALEHKVSPTVVLPLLENFPAATRAQSSTGRLPLHVALENGAQRRVIELLIQHHPEACACTDQSGYLPLHLACIGSNSERTPGQFGEIVRLLLKEHHEACMQPGKNGNLPLHLCLTHKEVSSCSNEALKMLITAHPEACGRKGDQGGYPIHRALKAMRHKSKVPGARDLEVERLEILVSKLPHSLDFKDAKGHTARVRALGHDSDHVAAWARTWGAFLSRYHLDEPCINESSSTVVSYATDVLAESEEAASQDASSVMLQQSKSEDTTHVCIKRLQSRRQFQNEIRHRLLIESHATAPSTITVLGWHTPEGEELDLAQLEAGLSPEQQQLVGRHCVEGGQRPQFTAFGDPYPYVLVLQRAERSLHEACAKERLARYDWRRVLTCVRDVALCMQHLHKCGLVHGDLKQRNVLRVERRGTETATRQPQAENVEGTRTGAVAQKHLAERWTLCDLDSAAAIGERIGYNDRWSQAYAPPELARRKFCHGGIGVDHADPSFDVWCLGVVLYELAAGLTLFNQDTSNDNLVEMEDHTILCAWHTISDDKLELVFSSESVDVPLDFVDDTRDLIRWCLKGTPTERPMVEQILAHRFFCARLEDPDEDGFIDPAQAAKAYECCLPRRTMRYHAFMSHAQADASGTVAALYMLYKQLGLYRRSPSPHSFPWWGTPQPYLSVL